MDICVRHTKSCVYNGITIIKQPPWCENSNGPNNGIIMITIDKYKSFFN